MYKIGYGISCGLGSYFIYTEIYSKIILNKSIKYGLKITREIITEIPNFEEKYIEQRTSMGFFIRPNLLITNYHVIQPFINSKTKNSKLIIKNDDETLLSISDNTPPAINFSEESSNLKQESINTNIDENLAFIKINSKEKIPMKIFYDKMYDLACIQVGNENNKYIDLESSEIFIKNLKTIFGDDIYKLSVFAIGPDKNNSKQISYGNILKSKIVNIDNTKISTINSKIYTPGGFSGGPLLSYNGYLIGVNFCALEPEFTTSFAIDINTILKFLEKYDNYIQT